MDLLTILNKANEGYPDYYLAYFYDERTGELKSGPGSSGDTLAKFIVSEISETYEASNSDDEQINEAVKVMETATEELRGVVQELHD